MAYNTVDNKAIISGNNGVYGNNAKGANYGRNAAANHFGYLADYKVDITTPNPDVFTKNTSIEQMAGEIKKLENEKMPPLSFTLQYAPKFNKVKSFFTKLFTGSAIDKQALLGFSYEAMDKKQAVSVETVDAAFKNEAFKDINAKLTTKAFDVNNDGKIDISEEAVSTVIADVLSKDEVSLTPENAKKALKKADGTYTNNGENKMMAFLNEENLETASKIAKDIHQKMGLEKAQAKFLKENS